MIKIIKKAALILCVVLILLVLFSQGSHFYFRLKNSNYETCQEIVSKQLIIVERGCGMDECANDYYDKNGHKIETVWEGMVDRTDPSVNTELHLQLENCSPTTYWKMKKRNLGTWLRF